MPFKYQWDRMTPEERRQTVFEQTKNMDKPQRMLARKYGSTNCEALHINFCKPPADGNYIKHLVKVCIGVAILGLILGLLFTFLGMDGHIGQQIGSILFDKTPIHLSGSWTNALFGR